MRAFIIRPFGTRKGIDFENVEAKLIAPALENVGAEGKTTGDILEAGNIRIDMFQQLLIADLVIADTTTNNPNAFYELGIRHALQEKRTFLIRAKLPPPQSVQEAKEADVPFDIKTDRYLEYDPADPAAALDKLTQALRDTAASDRQDSPVFLSLPNLRSQPRERFIPVPLGFGEDVQRAEKEKDGRKLTLLGLEARGFPWESTGLRVVGRALLLIKRYGAARTAWESLRRVDEYDLEANTVLANVYQRLDDLVSSDQALERALKVATEAADIAEIHGQLGRNKKDRWVRSWRDAATLEAKASNAIESPLLMEAYQQYLTAYRQDLDSYYPGLNALTLAVVMVELAAQYPDIWNAQFADDSDAALKLNGIKRKRDQMAQALQLRFDGADAPAPEGANPDEWLLSSAGDLNLLTQANIRLSVTFYRKAAAAGGDFVLDSARKQLAMLAQLGVLKDRIEEVLKVFPPESAPAANQRTDRVLLFTGHRIDAANRQKPRFPADKESVARDRIRSAVVEEKALAGNGSVIGVAGGANGGDLLFLEVCDELGIPTHMLLALPENQFIEASVESGDKSWRARFQAQLVKHTDAPVLAQSPALPKWLQFKRGYDVWQRNNLWLLSEALCIAPKNLTLIALWDGETGDGPGGTEHMVILAKERGAWVVRLDTKQLFGLSD